MRPLAPILVNFIPDVEKKAYLELGTSVGATFCRVEAQTKVGVDKDVTPACGKQGAGQSITSYTCTTDEFFARHAGAQQFDIVFIDACHEYGHVLRDFNNSVRILKENGIILLHDLIPPDEDFTSPRLCGDGYKLLWQWHTMGSRFPQMSTYSLCTDYGLTVVLNARGPWPSVPDIVDYESFAQEALPTVSFGELISIVRGSCVQAAAGEEPQSGRPALAADSLRKEPAQVSHPDKSSAALFREGFGDGGVLFNEDTAEALTVNAVGAEVWRLADGTRSLRDLADEVCRDFEEVPDTLQGDIMSFVADLKRRDFVS